MDKKDIYELLKAHSLTCIDGIFTFKKVDLQEAAKELERAFNHSPKPDVSETQWQAIEAYLSRFGTKHEEFNKLIKRQAREWFDKEFLKADVEHGMYENNATGFISNHTQCNCLAWTLFGRKVCGKETGQGCMRE